MNVKSVMRLCLLVFVVVLIVGSKGIEAKKTDSQKDGKINPKIKTETKPASEQDPSAVKDPKPKKVHDSKPNVVKDHTQKPSDAKDQRTVSKQSKEKTSTLGSDQVKKPNKIPDKDKKLDSGKEQAKLAEAHTQAPVKKSKRPNIVIFLADDLGIGDVGCFGNDTIKTPNIDNIAANGVKLTHFLTVAAVCVPSRSAFLTGRYPIRLGLAGTMRIPVNVVTANRIALSRDEITFAEVAKDAGYKTGLIGKWHMGLNRDHSRDNYYSPLKQGFDYFYGIPLTNLREYGDEEPVIFQGLPKFKMILFTTFASILLLGYALFVFKCIGIKGLLFFTLLSLVPLIPVWVVANSKMMNSLLYRNYELVEQPIRFNNLTQRLVKEGQNFLRERHDNDEPFLLFMSWLQVHTYLHTAPEFAGTSSHGQYGDNVEEMDWSVGEIMKTLQKYGMDDDTLVFFSSDHGGHIESLGPDGSVQGGYNGIYRGGKLQGAMEGGIRVPTVMSWPGVIPKGIEIDEPLSNMDLFPMISSVLRQPLPSDRVIDGKDMTPILKQEETVSPHDYLLHYCADKIHAVRWRPRKGKEIWKVKYASPNYMPGTEKCSLSGLHCRCDGPNTIWHDPPLIFDIVSNPREDIPISSNHKQYDTIIGNVQKAIRDHKSSVGEVYEQMHIRGVIWNPFLQPCCGGTFPFCHCIDSVYP